MQSAGRESRTQTKKVESSSSAFSQHIFNKHQIPTEATPPAQPIRPSKAQTIEDEAPAQRPQITYKPPSVEKTPDITKEKIKIGSLDAKPRFSGLRSPPRALNSQKLPAETTQTRLKEYNSLGPIHKKNLSSISKKEKVNESMEIS